MLTSSPRVRLVALALTLGLLAGLTPGCAFSPDEAVEDSAVQMSRDGYGVTGSAGSPAPGELNAEAASEPAVAADASKKADADRMVIRSKTLRLEVDSTTDAVEEIRSLVKANDGVIANLQVATDTEDWLYRYDEYGYTTGDGAALRGWVTIRVPADRFEAFVDSVITLGKVKYQTEDTEDVTQQHVDLSARLANLQAEEVRLRTFFDAAKNVEEMLAIEVELNRVRQEIESLDAQVKYLERQAAMATVTVELTEPQPVVRPSGDDWGFTDAITSGFRGAAEVVTFLIAFIIATAPLWIIAILVFLIIRAIVKRRRARRAPETAPTNETEA